MVKVSIIIPVYNVERYLNKCINSVMNQTLENIEIICIDDGSTDSSSQILDEIAGSDRRIRVVHKSNSGYGHAMNIGIEMAKGEYIGIVESDDYILPDMYETLYEMAKKLNVDVVKSDFYYYWERDNATLLKQIISFPDYYNKVVSDKKKILYSTSLIANWSGLYRRSMIMEHGIKHNETPGASFQDIGFYFQVMSSCQSVVWINNAFYMYRQDNPNSSVKSKQKMMSKLKEYDFIEKILKAKNDQLTLERCIYYRFTGIRNTFIRLDDSLKMLFLNIVREEYIKYKHFLDGNKDTKTMEWLKKIYDMPEAYCKNILLQKNRVLQIFKKATNIIIYGAGYAAYSVCAYLLENGFVDKVICVTLSNRPALDVFFGFKIVEFDKLKKHELLSALIIICASGNSRAYHEIENNLFVAGIENYIGSDMFQID